MVVLGLLLPLTGRAAGSEILSSSATDADGIRLSEITFVASVAGQPVRRVFAYYAAPSGPAPAEGWPAILLVHGGAGRAFVDWARQWARWGYAALAPDLNGRDASGHHLPDGGPVMSPASIYENAVGEDIETLWPRYALEVFAQSVSWLRARPEVSATRVGAMGISWGAVMTARAVCEDPQLRFVILAYGGGFLDDGSAFAGGLQQLPGQARARWQAAFDPGSHLHRLSAPSFWLTGTNDAFFFLPGWQKSNSAPAGQITRRLTPGWPHGYEAAWAAEECRAFADAATRDAVPLITVSLPERVGNDISASVKIPPSVAPSSIELVYTLDRGAWPARRWVSVMAEFDSSSDRLRANWPVGNPSAVYFLIKDQRNFSTSSPCLFAEEVLSAR